MKKIKEKDVFEVSKVIIDKDELVFELKLRNKFFGKRTIRLSEGAYIKMKEMIDNLIKEDFYSSKYQDRLVDKFLKTPIP
jgi:hypothetical protein